MPGFEEALDELVARYDRAGTDPEEIISALEVLLMRLKEEQGE